MFCCSHFCVQCFHSSWLQSFLTNLFFSYYFKWKLFSNFSILVFITNYRNMVVFILIVYPTIFLNLLSFHTNFQCSFGECSICKIVSSINIDEVALLPFQYGCALFFCPIALDRTSTTKLKMNDEIRHSGFVLELKGIHSVTRHYVSFGFFKGGTVSCHFQFLNTF